MSQKQSEPLEENPAKSRAKLLLQLFGPGNLGRCAIDEVVAQLNDKFGDQDVLSPEEVVHTRDYYRSHKELSTAFDMLVSTFKPSNPIHFENQPEVFPGTHQRSEGPRIERLEQLDSVKSFCSYDVLQQTPQVLDVPKDQQHVVGSWEPTASNVMPNARWESVITEEEVKARDDVVVSKKNGVTQVYKFASEDITLTMNRQDVVTTDTDGVPNGVNGDYSLRGQGQAKLNARKFRRVGSFDQTIFPSNEDFLTPKVDGEALFIKCRDGGGMAHDRIGNSWTVSCDQDFKLLVECVPGVDNPEQVFLTHAWRWNTVNNIGVLYGKELLKRKNIFIEIGGKRLPLLFPSFDLVEKYDGFVLHKGRAQFFFKMEPTIDVFKQETKAKIEETFGDKLMVNWHEGKAEYSVKWVGDFLVLNYVKTRHDKLYENELGNILEVCNAPDPESWIVLFEEKRVTRL